MFTEKAGAENRSARERQRGCEAPTRRNRDQQPRVHTGQPRGISDTSTPWTCLSPRAQRRPCCWRCSHLGAPSARPPPTPSPPGSHLGLSGSRGTPSFRQLTRGGGAPSTRQGSVAVWFTEAFTAGGPGWMVGTTAGGGHRERGCWEPVALRRAMRAGAGPTHCGSPRGRPGWCCPRRCGPCSCSRPRRPCSGPAAGGSVPVLGTGCGRPPAESGGGGTLLSTSAPRGQAPGRQERGRGGSAFWGCCRGDSLASRRPTVFGPHFRREHREPQ